MNRDSDIKVRMANYIYKDMSKEEIEEMDREISRDPELAESLGLNLKVKEYLKAKIGLEEMRSDPLLGEAEKLADTALSKKSFQEADGSEKETGKSEHKRKYIGYISLAAAVILVLFVIRLLVPFTDKDRLYQSYYEPLQASSYIQRNTGPLPLSGFEDGIRSYMNGDYPNSIKILSGVENARDSNPAIRLFLGLSYMGLEQYETAGVVLEDLINSSSQYVPEGLWYLGLCYLKTGDIERSREMLSRLEAFDGFYKKDSQALLRKLRRITR